MGVEYCRRQVWARLELPGRAPACGERWPTRDLRAKGLVGSALGYGCGAGWAVLSTRMQRRARRASIVAALANRYEESRYEHSDSSAAVSR
jgi:hypothetical protein